MKALKLSGILLATTALCLPGLTRAQTRSAAPATPAAAAATVAPPSPSADAGSGAIGEIVVTAQKRSERAQSVPINIAAISPIQIAEAGINSLEDIQKLVPTFHFDTVTGTLGSRLAIRGIGSFNNNAIEPSVATFLDGIYIPRPASIITSQLDVQQIEVLSGPQGTLFGRNASVGALTYTSGAPNWRLSDDFKVDYSRGDHARIEDVVNVPINDKVAVRIAGLGDFFGGYWTNDLTGKRFGGLDSEQARISVKMKLTDSLTWTVRTDYANHTGDDALNIKIIPSTLTPAALTTLTAKQSVAPNLDEFSTHNDLYLRHFFTHDSLLGFSSDLNWAMSNGYTLRLLDGYDHWVSGQGDGDTAYLAAYTVGRDIKYQSESNSHELQLISPSNLLSGKLNFVGGLYYFHEDLGILIANLAGPNFCNVFSVVIPAATCLPNVSAAGVVNSAGEFNQSTDSEAGYIQGTYSVLSNLKVTGGLRYTADQKTGNYTGTADNPLSSIFLVPENTNLKLDGDRLTYRANIAWTPLQDMLLFGTVSTGFKSGGFSSGAATSVLGQARIFQPETTTNYEVGAKSQFFDRRLTLNATAYRMDIDNYQDRQLVGIFSTVTNVGQVRQQGLEFLAEAKPVDFFTFTSSVAYLDSDIIKYCGAPIPAYIKAVNSTLPRCAGEPTSTQSLAGFPLNFDPKWSGVVGGEFYGRFNQYDMRWTVHSDVNFFSKQNENSVTDGSPLTVEPGYALVNVRATVYGPQDKWSLSLYANNITDTHYCSSRGYQIFDSLLSSRTVSPPSTAVVCYVGAPIVTGISFAAHF